MTFVKPLFTGCCGLLMCFAASNLFAQSDYRDDPRERRSEASQQQDRQGQQSGDQRRAQGQTRVEPIGWITIAYDYDNDGNYEGAEYLYYYDLQRARQTSDRRDRSGQMQSGDRASSDRQTSFRNGQRQPQFGDRQGGQDSQSPQTARLRGEVTRKGTTSVVMGQMEKEMTFVHLRTESGKTVRAYIGTPEKTSELDLREGDSVAIEGFKAKINDKKVLLGQKVQANGVTITNKMPRPEQWTRLRGEIRDLRTAAGDDRGQQHVIVEIRGDGETKTVDLGPTDSFEDVNLEEGDQVAVLARHCKIGGQSMLIAQKVRANDKTIDVREATNRSLRDAENGRRR